MIIGTTIMHDGAGSTPYYSPAFPRGGEAATFSINTTHLAGGPTLVVAIQHKNADETSWGVAGTFSNITATGITTKDVSDLKEMIRLNYTFSAGSAGDFVHVIVPAPIWRPF